MRGWARRVFEGNIGNLGVLPCAGAARCLLLHQTLPDIRDIDHCCPGPQELQTLDLHARRYVEISQCDASVGQTSVATRGHRSKSKSPMAAGADT